MEGMSSQLFPTRLFSIFSLRLAPIMISQLSLPAFLVMKVTSLKAEDGRYEQLFQLTYSQSSVYHTKHKSVLHNTYLPSPFKRFLRSTCFRVITSADLQLVNGYGQQNECNTEQLSVTNFSSENNLSRFQLNAPVVIRAFNTGTFSRNVRKLFSELKLVTDNLLFIYAEAK